MKVSHKYSRMDEGWPTGQRHGLVENYKSTRWLTGHLFPSDKKAGVKQEYLK